MYSIALHTLSARTTLGVFDWEKSSKRLVTLDVKLQIHGSLRKHSDDLADTVDYAQVEQAIVTRLEANTYQLLEALVSDVGNLLLVLDPRIHTATVTAYKPGALRQAQAVSITAEFARGDA